MKKENGQKKEFTVYFDDGSNYRFSLNESATPDDAKTYAVTWNQLAGKDVRIVKVTENVSA